MSYKPLVLVTAPVGTRSGYGAHSRDIVRSLIDMDKFDIKIWPVRWGSTPQNALDQKNQRIFLLSKDYFPHQIWIENQMFIFIS